jgi:uncharacterized low-complexity protein
MSHKSTLKPLAVAMGAAFVTSLACTPVANAAENPFAMTELTSGYMVADSKMEGKCGGDKKGHEEGKCGGDKKGHEEGKCGEGKCGGDKMKKEGGEGEIEKEDKGGDKVEEDK